MKLTSRSLTGVFFLFYFILNSCSVSLALTGQNKDHFLYLFYHEDLQVVGYTPPTSHLHHQEQESIKFKSEIMDIVARM